MTKSLPAVGKRNANELLWLARRIKTALSFDKGFIDLRDCILVADQLEQLALLEIDQGTVPRGANRSAEGGIADAGEPQWAMPGQMELTQIFDLPSPKYGRCLARFLSSSGVAFDLTTLAEVLDCPPHKARNEIYRLRYCLAKHDMHDAIVSARGRGYRMSVNKVEEIIKYVRDYKRYFIIEERS